MESFARASSRAMVEFDVPYVHGHDNGQIWHSMVKFGPLYVRGQQVSSLICIRLIVSADGVVALRSLPITMSFKQGRSLKHIDVVLRPCYVKERVPNSQVFDVTASIMLVGSLM